MSVGPSTRSVRSPAQLLRAEGTGEIDWGLFVVPLNSEGGKFSVFVCFLLKVVNFRRTKKDLRPRSTHVAAFNVFDVFLYVIALEIWYLA